MQQVGLAVIPGEQRETRNPGGITADPYLTLLDARLCGHDDASNF